MRVLYVNIEEKMAGAEKSLLLSLDVLKTRCEVVLACPSGQLSEVAVLKGITWKELPASPRSRWLSLAGMIYIIQLSLLQLCIQIKYKPDIAHVSNIVAAYACWLPCLVIKAKLIFHVRDVPKRRLVYRFIGSRVAAVIAVSEFIRLCLIKIGISEDIVFTVYNPLEGFADEQTGIVKRLNDNNGYIFANIGQFVPWKRQELFIDAAKIVAEKQPNTFFWVVGDDLFERNSGYRSFILNKIESCMLENRIVFKGWQDDMTSFWGQIDCLVHTADNEPFGRVVVEAMQASVPVVASDTGGPAEIVENGVTGCLVAHDDPLVFAAAMLKTFSDYKETNQITENAKRYVNENLSKSATSDELITVYKKVLAK